MNTIEVSLLMSSYSLFKLYGDGIISSGNCTGGILISRLGLADHIQYSLRSFLLRGDSSANHTKKKKYIQSSHYNQPHLDTPKNEKRRKGNIKKREKERERIRKKNHKQMKLELRHEPPSLLLQHDGAIQLTTRDVIWALQR